MPTQSRRPVARATPSGSMKQVLGARQLMQHVNKAPMSATPQRGAVYGARKPQNSFPKTKLDQGHTASRSAAHLMQPAKRGAQMASKRGAAKHGFGEVEDFAEREGEKLANEAQRGMQWAGNELERGERFLGHEFSEAEDYAEREGEKLAHDAQRGMQWAGKELGRGERFLGHEFGEAAKYAEREGGKLAHEAERGLEWAGNELGRGERFLGHEFGQAAKYAEREGGKLAHEAEEGLEWVGKEGKRELKKLGHAFGSLFSVPKPYHDESDIASLMQELKLHFFDQDVIDKLLAIATEEGSEIEPFNFLNESDSFFQCIHLGDPEDDYHLLHIVNESDTDPIIIKNFHPSQIVAAVYHDNCRFSIPEIYPKMSSGATQEFRSWIHDDHLQIAQMVCDSSTSNTFENTEDDELCIEARAEVALIVKSIPQPTFYYTTGTGRRGEVDAGKWCVPAGRSSEVQLTHRR